jgi:HPr kinase/phosphorylase
MRQSKVVRKKSVSVAFIMEQLQKIADISLETLADEGIETRQIKEQIVHRPGLALSGFTEDFPNNRIQLIGNPECRYLNHLSTQNQGHLIDAFLSLDIPCLIVTHNNSLPDSVIEMARSRGVPVFRTALNTARFVALAHDLLADQFAEQCTVHGSMVDVYGVGLLLTGKSGIGKSEVALDLIERGHRLVADDLVVISKRDENVLMGSGTDWVEHFMEIRGLGLIDIRAMFGIRAIRLQKRVEVIIDLHHWDESREYSRLDMQDEPCTIMDVTLPMVHLPIIPGKNMTVICEVIAMNHLLKYYGYDPAQSFTQKLKNRIVAKESGVRRGIEYFRHDYE